MCLLECKVCSLSQRTERFQDTFSQVFLRFTKTLPSSPPSHTHFFSVNIRYRSGSDLIKPQVASVSYREMVVHSLAHWLSGMLHFFRHESQEFGIWCYLAEQCWELGVCVTMMISPQCHLLCIKTVTLRADWGGQTHSCSLMEKCLLKEVVIGMLWWGG